MKKFNFASLFALIVMAAPSVAFANGGFQGPYAGVQFGWAAGHDSGVEYDGATPSGYYQRTKPKGAIYGAFGGYNWLVRPRVLLGFEADLEKRAQNGKSVQMYGGYTTPQFPVKTEVQAATSLRARLGYLFDQGSSLAFVTGGYAGADIKTTFGCVGCSTPTETHSQWANGWTAGVGLEHFFGQKISVKLAYRISSYGKRTVPTAQVYGGSFEENQKRFNDQSIRLGVAYHF